MAKVIDEIADFVKLRGMKGRSKTQNKRFKQYKQKMGDQYKGQDVGPVLPAGHFPQPAPGFKPKKYTNGSDHPGWSQDGLTDKIGSGWSWGVSNLKKGLKPSETIMGAAAGHAIRGAVWGGIGGGTMEAAQGGSFWDGAKAGAFNGAVGWSGYRMGMRMTGANSLNPFAGLKNASAGNQGLFAAAGRMTNTMSMEGKVARSAASMLNQTQRSGLSDAVTKGALKKAKA